MDKTKLKKEVQAIIDELPDETSWDELMYKIYVRQSIEQGLKDVEEGRVNSHEAVKYKYRQAK